MKSSSYYMDRLIDSIELVAAVFVGIVAADIFFSVLLRYFFHVSIPEHEPLCRCEPDIRRI